MHYAIPATIMGCFHMICKPAPTSTVRARQCPVAFDGVVFACKTVAQCS